VTVAVAVAVVACQTYHQKGWERVVKMAMVTILIIMLLMMMI